MVTVYLLEFSFHYCSCSAKLFAENVPGLIICCELKPRPKISIFAWPVRLKFRHRVFPVTLGGFDAQRHQKLLPTQFCSLLLGFSSPSICYEICAWDSGFSACFRMIVFHICWNVFLCRSVCNSVILIDLRICIALFLVVHSASWVWTSRNSRWHAVFLWVDIRNFLVL